MHVVVVVGVAVLEQIIFTYFITSRRQNCDDAGKSLKKEFVILCVMSVWGFVLMIFETYVFIKKDVFVNYNVLMCMYIDIVKIQRTRTLVRLSSVRSKRFGATWWKSRDIISSAQYCPLTSAAFRPYTKFANTTHKTKCTTKHTNRPDRLRPTSMT